MILLHERIPPGGHLVPVMPWQLNLPAIFVY